MNGYKTGGDWTDVTSIGRNEVVFEGRHKAYGAFYIRQRYPNALYFSMFSAILFVALCALIPYVFRHTSIPDAKLKSDEVITLIDVGKKPQIKPPLVTRPRFQPPKTNLTRQAPPLITRQNIDTLLVVTHSERPIPIPGNNGPVDNSAADIPTPDPGPDNNGIIKKDGPVYWASIMPKFQGGNIEDYLGSKINYPAEESQMGIQGTVYATFVIEKDGSVSNVTLLRGVSNGPGLNKEAIRVISEMPRWSPGSQDGHPVRVQYMIPIHFVLH